MRISHKDTQNAPRAHNDNPVETVMQTPLLHGLAFSLAMATGKNFNPSQIPCVNPKR